MSDRKNYSTRFGTPYETNKYRRAWSQPGANSATINWYRALFRQDDQPNSLIDVPTLVVWGKLDPHIMWQSAEPSAAMTTSGQVVYIQDATHWVLRDAPEQTGELLVNFFSIGEQITKKRNLIIISVYAVFYPSRSLNFTSGCR